MPVRKIRFRRGNQTNLPTLDAGEPGFALDTNRFYVGGNSANVEIATKSYVDSEIPTDISDLTDEEGLLEQGGSGPVQPYIELTNEAITVLPGVLGSPVSFTKSEGTPGDEIDEGLTITRGGNQGIYNSELEGSWNSSVSPAGTLWNMDGWGDLSNLNTRSYTNFYSTLGGNLGNNVIGAELIMWDTANDKYYKFQFTVWGQQNAGTVAYTRTEVTNPNFFKKTDDGEEIDVIVEDDGEGAGIGITRGANNGIYNPYREEGWDEDVSPDGTEWNIDGWDDLSDLESRTYTNFYDAYGNGQLGNRVPGSRAVMYVPETETYYAIQWISWTQGGNGGGFSYFRYEIDLDQIQEGIKFADGSVLKSATEVARIKSTASGNRRIEDVSGSKTVYVTSVVTESLTTTASRAETGVSIIWMDPATTTIDDVIDDPAEYGIHDMNTVEFSVDNTNWYKYNFSSSSTGSEIGYGINGTVSYSQGDTIYFRYDTGGEPIVWWDKNELPRGGANFRGAVIDYHAYTGEGTIIGTIHIVDDDGEENITHTEVSSGSTDSENDDLWLVQNEGTISYRRIDGESKTLKIHWTARVFYGSEFYD